MLKFILTTAIILATILVVRCAQIFSIRRATIRHGVPIPYGRLLHMATRGIPPGKIADSFVFARKRGFDVTLEKIEQHCLNGGQPDAVVGAMIKASNAGIELSFDDVAKVDFSGIIPSTLDTEDLRKAIEKLPDSVPQ